MIGHTLYRSVNDTVVEVDLHAGEVMEATETRLPVRLQPQY
jgi:hypothetical protein